MDISEIRRELQTQDNASTAWPVFVVQQRRRIYGFDPNYGDDSSLVWIDTSNDCAEATAEEAAELDAEFEVDADEPDGWVRTGYVDQWEFVTACFTRAGAEAYIAAQRHNLCDPRVYVESAHRNREWQAIERHLRGVA